ncbi:MAG: putative motility protein [Myxococcota bacterium]
MSVGSVSGAAFADQYAVAVGKKALDSVKQQGQDALKLIQAAAPAAPANVAPGIGQSLNVVA